MKARGAELAVHFGATADPLAEQLAGTHGFAWAADDVALSQRLADAVTLLSIHGMIADGPASIARRRILSRIARAGSRA